MGLFRSNLLWIAASACLLAGPADAATTWRKVSEREFPGWRAELQRLVDHAGARTAHVCVIVRGDSVHPRESELLAYVREDRHIQGFAQPAAPYLLDDTAMAGSEDIDLDRDVVATEAQIEGSTSRVTKAYVDEIIGHCRSAGTQIVLTRRAHRCR